MMFLGTIVNAVAVIVGSLIGVLASGLLSKHRRLQAIPDVITKALGLNMVGATKIKVANMLPAIFLPLMLCFFF